MKKGDKRGSHVGIMLSFVIFVTFLIFLYTIIKPTTQRDKQYLLDYLEKELKEKFSANLTTTSININEEINEKCVDLKNLVNETGMISPIIIKDDSKKILAHKISENDLLIEKSDDNFFKIYYSKEFQEQEGLLENCQEANNYIIGFEKTNEYIFEKKIIELINKNYDDLKKDLKIPEENEFSFSFTNSTDGVIKTKGKNESLSVSIYAEEFIIQYVDEKANILPGSIKIKLW